jgi:catalase
LGRNGYEYVWSGVFVALLLFCYINKKNGAKPLAVRYPCRHTFSFINVQMERYRIRFDFRNQQGIKNLNDEKAAKARRQVLREPPTRPLDIEQGDYPRRNLDVRAMPQKNAAKSPDNPFASFATFNLKGERR